MDVLASEGFVHGAEGVELVLEVVLVLLVKEAVRAGLRLVTLPHETFFFPLGSR